MSLTTEIILHFYFPFKAFPENERERERERESARAREEKRRTRSRRRKIAPLIAISPSRDHAGSRSRSTAREEDSRLRDLVCRRERKIRDRDRRFARSHRRSRSRLHEIAPSIAISRRRQEIAIASSIAISDRDLVVDRDLGSRSTVRSSDWICRC